MTIPLKNMQGWNERMGHAELIGDGPNQLIPKDQPKDGKGYRAPRRKNSAQA